jgi:hypothetical protein
VQYMAHALPCRADNRVGTRVPASAQPRALLSSKSRARSRLVTAECADVRNGVGAYASRVKLDDPGTDSKPDTVPVISRACAQAVELIAPALRCAFEELQVELRMTPLYFVAFAVDHLDPGTREHPSLGGGSGTPFRDALTDGNLVRTHLR